MTKIIAFIWTNSDLKENQVTFQESKEPKGNNYQQGAEINYFLIIVFTLLNICFVGCTKRLQDDGQSFKSNR